MAERDVYGAHSVKSTEGRIQFDSDLSIALYDEQQRRYTLLGPRLIVTDFGTRIAVGCRDTDGMAVVVTADGYTRDIERCFGRYTYAIRLDADRLAEVYVMVPGRQGVQVYTHTGEWLRQIDAPYSSTGILDILPDGEPLMTTDARCSRSVEVELA